MNVRLLRDLRPAVLPFLAAEPGRLALGVLLAALTVAMGMGLLGLSGWFITATALAGVQAATAIGFDVFMPSAGIRLLALGRTASRYGERLVSHDATFAVLAALRERLFLGWAQPTAARQLLMRPARLLFRLTSDIDALESLYLRSLLPAGAALGAALLAGVMLGVMRAWMGLALAAWLVAAGWGIALVVARRAAPASLRRARAIEALRERAVDLVAGQTDLVMAGRTAAQRALLAAADRHLAHADRQLHRLETGAGMAYGVTASITLAAVLLATGALAEEHAIGAPAAALVVLMSLAAVEPFAALRRGAIEAGRTWLAARRLGPRLAATATDASSFARPMQGEALVLRQVRLAHPGSRVAVLRDVSLTLRAGERVALIGSSGAGKSTLLGLAAGELRAQSGEVQMLPNSLLTQRVELFQDSLRDNLRLADPLADDARLWTVLEAAGLAREVHAMPSGLDTRLGEGGLGLSGGQARRLALARLLLRNVSVWLLDEPTEALDTATARDVLQRLDGQAAGRAVLIATHMRREAALADRLVRMEEGVIVAELPRGTREFDIALGSLRSD